LNEKAADLLKDKEEIILLLGSTGCGKSTTVHYLCGSKMKET
jgi:ABC-type sugar transport system ATPase subunit